MKFQFQASPNLDSLGFWLSAGP